jgi:hypothetical protein
VTESEKVRALDRYAACEVNFDPLRPIRIAVPGARSAPKDTVNQSRAPLGYQERSP